MDADEAAAALRAELEETRERCERAQASLALRDTRVQELVLEVLALSEELAKERAESRERVDRVYKLWEYERGNLKERLAVAVNAIPREDVVEAVRQRVIVEFKLLDAELQTLPEESSKDLARFSTDGARMRILEIFGGESPEDGHDCYPRDGGDL